MDFFLRQLLVIACNSSEVNIKKQKPEELFVFLPSEPFDKQCTGEQFSQQRLSGRLYNTCLFPLLIV